MFDFGGDGLELRFPTGGGGLLRKWKQRRFMNQYLNQTDRWRAGRLFVVRSGTTVLLFLSDTRA